MNHYSYDEIVIGLKEEFLFPVTEEKMQAFKLVSGDENPMHCDEHYARESGFDGRVVYGMLDAAAFSALAGMYIPGEKSLLQCVEASFIRPVYVGSVLKVCGEVIEKNDKFRLVTVKVSVYNEDMVKVCRGRIEVRVLG